MKSLSPSFVVRPWGTQWQLWKRQRASADWSLVETGDWATLKVPAGALCAVPARLVVTVPFWIESAGAEADRDIGLLEIEMKGLASGERLESDVFLSFLKREENQTLVLGVVFPSDLPSQSGPVKGASYEASPALAVLGDNTVHLWRELDDLVAAFTWKGQLVCWETMTWTNDTREIEVWLGCLLQQLKEELRIDVPLLLKEWVGIFADAPDGFLRDPILNETDRREGPAISLGTSVGWRPLQARLADKVQQQRRSLSRTVAVATGLILLFAVGGLFATFRTQWKIRQADAALRSIEKEVAPLREAAARWSQMEAAVDQHYFPLEALHTIVGSMGPAGVRLTAFEMSPDKILVEGEAANVSAATEFLKTLQASDETTDLAWEMPPPSLQANSTARFIINGVRHGDVSP